MFSGIVETVGIIKRLEFKDGCMHITILPQLLLDDLHIGDSVAVNGVCLTVTALEINSFSAVIVPQTLRLTNLKSLALEAIVNLERAVKASSRIGGHNVQGHIDTCAEIIEIKSDGAEALLATFAVSKEISRYIVSKGYISIDGMSITVIDATATSFTVTFIPHTLQASIAQFYRVGTQVNIEVDIMGKYIEKLLGAYDKCILQ
jgi:riboflavin synthase